MAQNVAYEYHKFVRCITEIVLITSLLQRGAVVKWLERDQIAFITV